MPDNQCYSLAVGLRQNILAVCALVTFGLPAHAVIIHDQSTHSSYYNVSGPEFNGIGRVVLSNSNVCTAFAINAFQVLTAAHCLPGGNPNLASLSLSGIQFSLFSSDIYTPTSVVIHPNWDYNDFSNGFDVAVLNFANGLPAVNFYPIYTYAAGDNELGDSFELFGYGRCGTPQVGNFGCATQGLRRAANRVDNITPNERIFEFSFDSYSGNTVQVGSVTCREHDALCQADGIETPSKEFVPEIGTRQGIVAPGDSGGPSLIQVAGQYFSIGMHSYLSCISANNACISPPDFDGSASPNGSWGEIAGNTRLSSYTDFIQGVAEVPEPSSALLVGTAIFLAVRRWRVLNSSKTGPPAA